MFVARVIVKQTGHAYENTNVSATRNFTRQQEVRRKKTNVSLDALLARLFDVS